MKSFAALLLLSLAFFSCNNDALNTKADSWQLTGFVKVDSINPILKPAGGLRFTCPLQQREVQWEERNVLNPAAVVRNDTVFLFFRAQDMNGTSRIGMATSVDGLHFIKTATPVFYPATDSMKRYEWNSKRDSSTTLCNTCFDGVEDPRIVESEDGVYIMTYTAYDGAIARLALASSKDLRNWTKHGLVLNTEKYKNRWSKSGAIVAKQQDSKIIATKINGKYWMYFGDTDIFMASSDDLIHWEVAENAESHQLISVLHPRPGYFDSRLVEPGPYALLKEEGILFIYNGSNAANFNDTSLPKFTYAAGQALFDKNNPYQLIDRSKHFFIHPDKEYEKLGEVNEVCFVEGLVFFRNQWFLYYGTADSKIAVAVKE
jgi:beta-1,2-mannosidase